MIKKFKLFISPIPGLGKWLNKMSSEGYRLIKAGDVFYHFEECEKDKYVYAVDYVANKSYDDLKEYERFLEESNIRYMEKSANIGKVSMGSVRLRPYADKGARIATSRGMINREFLILEKVNDGKPFHIYTNVEDRINALKTMRKPIIAMMLFIGIMFSKHFIDFISAYRWSLFEINGFSKSNIGGLIIIGIVEAVLFMNFIKLTLEINRLKVEGDIYE